MFASVFDYLELSRKLFALFSLLLNSILIVLIVFRSPHEIGKYRFLMIYMAIFNVYLSIIDVLLKPIVFSNGLSCFATTQILSFLPNRKFNAMINCSFYGSYVGALEIFTFHYFYRYGALNLLVFIVIQYEANNFNFTKRTLMISFILPILYGFLFASILYNSFGETPEALRKVQNSDLFKNYEHLKINETTFIDVFYLTEDNENQTFHFAGSKQLFGGIALMLLCVCVVCRVAELPGILMIYFGVKCYFRWTKSRIVVSSRTKNLQKQLLRSLVLQTILSLLTMYIPEAITVLALLIPFDLGVGSIANSFSIALFPVLDPIPTILIISNYRNTLRDFLGFWNPMKIPRKYNNHRKILSTKF